MCQNYFYQMKKEKLLVEYIVEYIEYIVFVFVNLLK